ncbi:MAG: hypothetical protein IPK26_10000 [Planctomycetes bacterium]|nr:hypothetical protein [Planctomycetota bacterium]
MSGLPLAALLAACVGPEDTGWPIDESGDHVTVTVLDNDWVRVGDRRLPVDLFLLEMRQRTRPLPPEEARRMIVHILVEAPATLDVRHVIDRLADQLFIAGIRQIRYL